MEIHESILKQVLNSLAFLLEKPNNTTAQVQAQIWLDVGEHLTQGQKQKTYVCFKKTEPGRLIVARAKNAMEAAHKAELPPDWKVMPATRVVL